MKIKNIRPIISALLFAAMLLAAYPFAIKAMGEAHGLWQETDPEPEQTQKPSDITSPEATPPTDTSSEPEITSEPPADITTDSLETRTPEDSTLSPESATISPEVTDSPETTTVPTPETTYYEPVYNGFSEVDKSYFADALFIGDSRTVGLRDYSAGNLDEALFFCNSGMTANKARQNETEVCSGIDRSGVKTSYGTYTLERLLTEKRFGKIYIMIGINEMGSTVKNITYGIKLLSDMVRQYQPDALIFYCANLHVTKEYSDNRVNKYISNEKINEINSAIAELADWQTGFYINVNEYFDDADHALTASYSGDGVHVYGKYYRLWSEWLRTKGIVDNRA